MDIDSQDSIGAALLEALKPSIESMVAAEVEKRLATQAVALASGERQVIGYRECHDRYGVSRKGWEEAIASGQLRGVPKRMRGGRTGYMVAVGEAARVFAGLAPVN